MYKTRWITALVLIPVVVSLIYLGGLFFFALVAAAAILAMWEWYGILCSRENAPSKGWIAWSGFAFAPAILFFACRNEPAHVLALMGLNLVCAGCLAVLWFKKDGAAVDDVLRQVLCVLYIPGALATLAIVRAMPEGAHWVLLILVTVFAGDTGALYTGTYFGKHKLCPSVSPKKTIEGAVGGMAASIVGGFVVKLLLLRELPADACLLFCIFVNVAGQMGDLFESAAKRAAGVKDSGRILPGHGGLLDRIDGLLFGAPVAFLFRLIM